MPEISGNYCNNTKINADCDAAETIDCPKETEQALGAKICKNLFPYNAQKTCYSLLLLPCASINYYHCDLTILQYSLFTDRIPRYECSL